MNNKKNHNTIYLLTTLSVYLGLVVVGSSPQVLAQAKLAQHSHSSSFEINAKTDSGISKLKFKSQFQYEDVLPFAFLGSLRFDRQVWNSQTAISNSLNLNPEIFVENDQIFTLPILPRASI